MAPRILVVDDDRYDNERYCQVLRSAGYEVQGVLDAEQALHVILSHNFEVVVLDMLLPMRIQGRLDFGGIEVLRRIKERDVKTQVIAVTGYGSRELAAEAMAAGAIDYITKDLDTEDRLLGSMRVAISRTQQLRAVLETVDEYSTITTFSTPSNLVANSDTMRQLLRRAQRLAGIEGPILITGEPGVGKELIASVLHINSHYSSGPFKVVSCRSLSASMVELWGDTKHSIIGLCEQAEGGTLVLKSIESLPYNQQKQLVNLVDQKVYKPLGTATTKKCHLRIIATTTVDLSQLVQRGQLWRPLYESLSLANLYVPPLRERQDDDIMGIAGYLLNYYGLAPGIAPSATSLLVAYSFAQGNIKELEDILRSAAMQSGGGVIQLYHLPKEMLSADTNPKGDAVKPNAISSPLPDISEGILESVVAEERAERITALHEQIRVKKRRLNKRETQAAEQGINVDPSVINEVEDIKRDIVSLEKKIQSLIA